jgi:hypothetical protein
MENHSDPRIVGADRLAGGVVITFDDGKAALYPASLLYATLPQAQQIADDELDSISKMD